jgi:hypothetical protein
MEHLGTISALPESISDLFPRNIFAKCDKCDIINIP